MDHQLLLQRLSEWLGVTGSALQWIKSYITDRSETVCIAQSRSEFMPLDCGVHQGSVLGPVLFTTYTLPLDDIARHNVKFHLYADDTKLYISFIPGVTADESFKQMHDCVSHIQTWMSRNFMRLNAERTQVLVVGSRHDHAKFTSQQFSINNHDLSASKSARNLGVVFDKLFNMESHISSVCKSANFHLRNIAKIRKYLSLDTAEKVIHALVSSRLDCCNSLLVGLPATSTSRLQHVHNNAARALSKPENTTTFRLS